MKIEKNAAGLYVFSIGARFKGKQRVFNGLVDTGSTICASTYHIITTLRARPTSFKKVANPMQAPIKALGYSLKFTFDGKSAMTNVYRLPLDMPGIDFILGMPILDLCKITMGSDTMEIEWL